MAATAHRLVMAISDAVRRAAQQRLTDNEEQLDGDGGRWRRARRPTSCVAISVTTSWPC
ncbi:hypothetical protein ACF09Z_00535 [Streptomyces erythrochromogenes]|uniref:hypothetical protein n=1 Tax=Streptomyces erythrochromogenes TaxID=285574 RepID=UPI0036F65705